MYMEDPGRNTLMQARKSCLSINSAKLIGIRNIIIGFKSVPCILNSTIPYFDMQHTLNGPAVCFEETPPGPALH
jgi:hypothetical protein